MILRKMDFCLFRKDRMAKCNEIKTLSSCFGLHISATLLGFTCIIPLLIVLMGYILITLYLLTIQEKLQQIDESKKKMIKYEFNEIYCSNSICPFIDRVCPCISYGGNFCSFLN